MALPAAASPTRLVICVDGTSSANNQATNIHRISSVIKHGNCFDSFSGAQFNQVVEYVPSIGSADDALSKDRIQASVFGKPYLKPIQDVYESCCQLNSVKDEVWLFGFSRGAYVVRAVAGLLHAFGALSSAGRPEFSKDFKKILKETERRSGSSSLLLSPVTSTTSAGTRLAPRIQFVGVFDTIKAISDDSLFDTSFNPSIHHMRHAVALHEDRKALTPDYLFPEEFYRTRLQDYKRSFVQAHFVGNHNDLGGYAKKAGLGLYPLQWMLLEARNHGLFLSDFGGGSMTTPDAHDPLSLVFPKPKKGAKSGAMWSCTTANGITVSVQDLRDVHHIVRYDESYGIKLDSKLGSIRQKKARETFDANGTLRGYCDWAPQGTIIHPSVYMLLDEHVNVALETKEVKLQRYLEDWRARMLGSKHGAVNPGFWLDGEDDDDGSAGPGAIRVLVCGNTGVGKSTLINKTFGVDVTQSSDRTRGIHDVREEITFQGRPDLIVHDSGGFEAGADEEFQAIESFLKEKSTAVEILDRLHVIWFCIDINSSRTLQTATEKLFQAVSEYASDVPIIVVATKKDELLDIEFGVHRKALKREGKRFDEEACEQYAEEKLQERIEVIQTEMSSIPNGRLDACLAVSQDDEASIRELSQTTSRCFDEDKIRTLYVRAQVSRIDLKVELALVELMRRYKKLVRSAVGTSFAVGGATIHSRIATTQMCRALTQCFGLVTADAAIEALKASVWNHIGSNVLFAMADGIQAIGVTGTVFAAGIPAWLVTGSINATYVVPAVCRLYLIMACDLIFVLARSFKEVAYRSRGQPNDRDVTAAARNYRLRGYSQHVHSYIKRLVPRRDVRASYRVERIRRGIDDMFEMYKDKLLENVDLPLKVGRLRIGSDAGDDNSTETGSMVFSDDGDDNMTDADSTLLTDITEASEDYQRNQVDEKRPLAPEPGAVELDASTPIVELPGESKVVELPGISSLRNRYELQ